MSEKKPLRRAAVPEVSAASFPALRRFLRGYLHEDWAEDYDSAAQAAQQFCEDADREEWQQVLREWQAFQKQVKGQPLREVNRLLQEKLGGAWEVQSAAELDAMGEAFSGGRQQP
jgi:hypothetical protein